MYVYYNTTGTKMQCFEKRICISAQSLRFAVRFSAAVCGASFDAEKVRNCPSCGSAYPLEENEWVVTDIRI